LVLHNTQWVPGHFHFYLLLAVIPMTLALMFHVTGRRSATQAPPNSRADNVVGFALLLVGGLTLAFSFLRGGLDSVARRRDMHLDAWLGSDVAGAVGGTLMLLAMLYFAIRITAGLLRRPSAAGGLGAGTADAAG